MTELGAITANLSGRVAAFIDAMDPGQRAEASFPFEDEERRRWAYTPVDRRGVPLKRMNPSQRVMAFQILEALMSDDGAATVRSILAHEDILEETEKAQGIQRFDRDPTLYYFSVFGDPATQGPWGVRVEGHHLSLHAVCIDDRLTVVPSFFGANPAEVRIGDHQRLRILAPLEDRARSLLESFDDVQLKAAIISDAAPKDILTTNLPSFEPPAVEGLPGTDLSDPQLDLLMSLVEAYAQRYKRPVAVKALEKLTSFGPDSIWFAWAGGFERGDAHYYRVQAESFLIEYDNFQNEANHAHAVWRDASEDFGMDLLREHHVHDHGLGS